MKSNLIITSCAVALVFLAVALVALTVQPAVTTVSHTESSSYSWYFKPREDGRQPVVADNATFLSQYDNVRYLGSPDSKDLFLTFDVGYENGNTEKILDILKEKKVPAAFFVTGHYVESNPDLIKRMEAEGHLVCNHTLNHKDLSAISSPEELAAEVDGLAAKYREIVGKEMPKYLRPPEGKYCERMLKIADQEGYTVVFWSFAYKDWLNDEQPDASAAMEKILKRTHPGAVLLLHSNSATNAQILGDVIDKWQADGYTLKSLDNLPAPTAASQASPSPSSLTAQPAASGT